MVSSIGGGGGDTRSLQAEPGESSSSGPTPLAVSVSRARDEVPALADALEAAATGSRGTVDGPDAVDRSVDFLQDQARTVDNPSVSPGIPRDGLLSWDGRIVQVRITQG